MIEAVLFDLDGTLLDHDGAAACALASALGVPDAPVALWRELETRAMAEYLAGRVTFPEQRRQRVLGLSRERGLGIRGDDEADRWFEGYLRAYEAAWRAYPDVEPALEKLAGAGFTGARTGVVTNGEGAQQRRKLAALGLEFGLVVAAGDVGTAKPRPDIFTLACDRLGLAPGQVLYVGDSLAADARGARGAGLTGVWLDRSGVGEGQNEGVPVIRTLTDLPALVASTS